MNVYYYRFKFYNRICAPRNVCVLLRFIFYNTICGTITPNNEHRMMNFEDFRSRDYFISFKYPQGLIHMLCSLRLRIKHIHHRSGFVHYIGNPSRQGMPNKSDGTPNNFLNLDSLHRSTG